MKLNESMRLLNDLKIGRGGDICIKIPGTGPGKRTSGARTYVLTGERIISIFEVFKNVEKAKGINCLKGIVVFGSSVCASHQMIKHKYLFGLICKKRKHLIYDKGRRPNDVDIMFVVDDEVANNVDLGEFPGFISVDIKASYYVSGGYGGMFKQEEVRKKELDIIFITESQLVEKHEEGDAIIGHIETAGVLALGECPIKLRGAAFFSANKRNLSLTFPTI